MLTPEQIELVNRAIDRELDGHSAATPEVSAAFRALIADYPEAAALAAELRALSQLLRRVEERAPPPQLRQTILDALPARASPSDSRNASEEKSVLQAVSQWFVSQLDNARQRMEEGMMTKKALIIGTTAVAIIAAVGGIVVQNKSTEGEAGTIGGVQQASRYRGRAMSERDVTIANPDIAVLFQNQDVLTLVKSEVFRSAMQSEAFRSLQSNEAFRRLMSSEAYHELMQNEAYHELMSNEAYHELMQSEAYHELANNEAYRELMSSEASRSLMQSEAYRELANNEAYQSLANNEAFRSLQSNEAFRKVMSNEAFRAVSSNEAFRSVMSNEAFRSAMSNEAFRSAMQNDAFRSVMSNDAFRSLQSNEAFRSLSRSAQLSEVFLSEAMRAGR